jgi:type I restriction enzyme S subunit
MMATATKNTKAFYNSELPRDWSSPEFGDVFNFVKTFSFSREQLTSETTTDEIRNIHYGDIHATYENEILDFEIEKTVPYLLDGIIDAKSFEDENFPSLKEGDLIIADASEDYEGVCDCVELKNINGAKVVSGLHTFAARASEDKIALGYRTYALQHEQVIRELRRIATGTSVYGVSKTNLSKVKIPLPPLPEQKAIAQVLSTADAGIHTTEKLIAQKELRKKWLMQQLLTGKKRLKGFGGEWKEHSYEKILKVVKRNFAWDENELYKLISVRRRSGGIFYREALYGHQILVKTLRTANEGDFLFSKMQILHGASALVTKEFDGAKISGSYIAVVPKEKKQLNMEFFQWYSQTPYFYHQTYISSYGVHIEKMTFDFDTFLQLEMKLPSIEEQTAIATVLQAADKEISLLKAKAERLREQKKGLMQQLLTGKVRLKIN